eukprot:2632401-Alexandrium_andersonii.AAC.1
MQAPASPSALADVITVAAEAAAPRADVPRKPWMDQHTFGIVVSRREYRRTAIAQASLRKRELARWVVAVWLRRPGREFHHKWAREAAERARFAHDLPRCTRSQLRAAAIAAKHDFVRNVCAQAAAAVARRDVRGMYRALRRLEPFRPRPHAVITAPDGIALPSFRAMRGEMLRHYCE